jgi:hypothetical protein
MNDLTSPITREEYETACAAARKLSPTALLAACRADLPTPTVFDCGIPTEKIFGIKARLDALEDKAAVQDLGGDTMTRIDRGRIRAGMASVKIGPSRHGKFRNDDNSVNLSEVLDFEAEAAKDNP